MEFPVSITLFHPLFLYESLWSLVAFIVLLNPFIRNRQQIKVGTLFLFYLIQYSVIRFLLEFLAH
ncbi:MAG UNVERIFIED_CONTAM: prolipoprotein diacylglyceryl transferase [Anaerolineae bacterium]